MQLFGRHRSTSMGCNVLFQGKTGLLGFVSCLVRKALEPVILDSRGGAHLFLELCNRSRKLFSCRFVPGYQPQLFFTGHDNSIANYPGSLQGLSVLGQSVPASTPKRPGSVLKLPSPHKILQS